MNKVCKKYATKAFIVLGYAQWDHEEYTWQIVDVCTTIIEAKQAVKKSKITCKIIEGVEH